MLGRATLHAVLGCVVLRCSVMLYAVAFCSFLRCSVQHCSVLCRAVPGQEHRNDELRLAALLRSLPFCTAPCRAAPHPAGWCAVLCCEVLCCGVFLCAGLCGAVPSERVIRRMRGQYLEGEGCHSPKACSDVQISDGRYGIHSVLNLFITYVKIGTGVRAGA